MAPPRGRSLSAQSDNNVATTHWGPRAVGGGDREWSKPRSRALRPSWSGMYDFLGTQVGARRELAAKRPSPVT